MTQCTQPFFDFQPLDQREVVARFDGGKVTSDMPIGESVDAVKQDRGQVFASTTGYQLDCTAKLSGDGPALFRSRYRGQHYPLRPLTESRDHCSDTSTWCGPIPSGPES